MHWSSSGVSLSFFAGCTLLDISAGRADGRQREERTSRTGARLRACEVLEDVLGGLRLASARLARHDDALVLRGAKGRVSAARRRACVRRARGRAVARGARGGVNSRARGTSGALLLACLPVSHEVAIRVVGDGVRVRLLAHRPVLVVPGAAAARQRRAHAAAVGFARVPLGACQPRPHATRPPKRCCGCHYRLGPPRAGAGTQERPQLGPLVGAQRRERTHFSSTSVV